MVAFGVWAVRGSAGVLEADLAGGGQGAVGLPWLLTEQSAALGGVQEALVDLAVLEGATGDEVVEVAAGLPQPPVPLPDRSVGDAAELLGQRRPRVRRHDTAGGRYGDDWGGWPVGLPVLQPLQEGGRHRDEWGSKVTAGHELVAQPAVVAAWGGDHIPAATSPIDMRQPTGLVVAEAGGGQVDAPLGCQVTMAALISR
jgi:hypothetical protein